MICLKTAEGLKSSLVCLPHAKFFDKISSEVSIQILLQINIRKIPVMYSYKLVLS